MEYIVIALVIAGCLLLVFQKNKKPTEEILEKQKREYEEILKVNQVPEQHYKIVVGQSKVYNIYNCRQCFVLNTCDLTNKQINK